MSAENMRNIIDTVKTPVKEAAGQPVWMVVSVEKDIYCVFDNDDLVSNFVNNELGVEWTTDMADDVGVEYDLKVFPVRINDTPEIS